MTESTANTNIEVKRKRGRPREFFYTEDHAEAIKTIMACGGDVAEVCLALGLKSKETFYRHLDKNEQLKDDYSEGKLLREVWYRNRIKDVIENPDKEKNKNLKVKLFMWQAANQHPDVFSHNVNPGAAAPSTVNIQNLTQINTNPEAPQLEYEAILEKLQKFAQNPQITKDIVNAEIVEEDGAIE